MSRSRSISWVSGIHGQAPRFIRVCDITPGLNAIVSLVAMVIAVRQALDYESTGQAVGICAIGWAGQEVLLAALFALMNGLNTPA